MKYKPSIQAFKEMSRAFSLDNIRKILDFDCFVSDSIKITPQNEHYRFKMDGYDCETPGSCTIHCMEFDGTNTKGYDDSFGMGLEVYYGKTIDINDFMKLLYENIMILTWKLHKK